MRIYAYIACALAIAGLLAYGSHVVKKANQFDVASKALSAERIAHKSDLDKIKSELATSIQEREALNKGLTEIARRFNQPAPPPKTLVKYVQVPGENCPRASLSDAFIVRYNAASD